MSSVLIVLLTTLLATASSILIGNFEFISSFIGKSKSFICGAIILITAISGLTTEILLDQNSNEGEKHLAKVIISICIFLLILCLLKLRKMYLKEKSKSQEIPLREWRFNWLPHFQSKVKKGLKDTIYALDHLDKPICLNLLMYKRLKTTQNYASAKSTVTLLKENNKEQNSKGHRNSKEWIFDTFNREDTRCRLLILGQPNSGKTVTLLELASTLTERALKNDEESTPMLFKLSNWKDKKQDFRNWLIEQVKLQEPDITPNFAEKLVIHQTFLPFLDGLDKIPNLDIRIDDCIQQINKFVDRAGCRGCVITCRKEIYEQLYSQRESLLRLNSIVELQPLQDKQIEIYFQKILGSNTLWADVKDQPQLRTLLETDQHGNSGLLRSPLFLSILAKRCKQKVSDIGKQELIEEYIRDNLGSAKKSEQDYKEARSKITWLAKKMKSAEISDFKFDYIRMSPSLFRNRYHPELVLGIRSKHSSDESADERALGIDWLGKPLLSLHKEQEYPALLFLLFTIPTVLATLIAPFQIWTFILATIFAIFGIILGCFLIFPGFLVYTVTSKIFPQDLNKIDFENVIKTLRNDRWEFLEKTAIIKRLNVYSKNYFLLLLSLSITGISTIGAAFLSIRISNIFQNQILNVFFTNESSSFGIASAGFMGGFFIISACIAISCIGNKNSLFNLELSQASDFDILKDANNFSLAIDILKMLLLIVQSSYVFGVLIIALLGNIPVDNIPITPLFPLGIWIVIYIFQWPVGYLQRFPDRFILCHSAYVVPWNYPRFLDDCVKCRLMQKLGNRYRFIDDKLLEYFADEQYKPEGS